MENKKRICIAGATGWAGSALAKAIISGDEFELVCAVSRSAAGKNLIELFSLEGNPIPVYDTVAEALQVPFDILVEYTKPEFAMQHIKEAVLHEKSVLIGTSGLTDTDYEEINTLAEEKQVAVLAVGNFAISVVLLNKFAEMAAKYMNNWEIIDYASASKPDTPSGSARELAYRLGKVKKQQLIVPISETQGEVATRGADMNGTQVHALRLPGFVISLEAIFGNPDEKLILKHEAGTGAQPYVAGALLAIRNLPGFVGLKRGLDSVMDL